MSDKLRLRFSKTGRSVYISHLDLMATMQRAFSRAGVPLKYSEGYNPHPLISIALPLPVGTGSFCELMDFRLQSETELSDLPERLTAALPEGLRALEVYVPERKCAEIKWLEIEGSFEYDERPAEDRCEALRVFFGRERLVVCRKTKRGEGETDIRPSIRSIAFSAEESGVRVRAILSAQEPTLKPELLVDALRQLQPELAPDFARFIRIETYDRDMIVFR